MRIRMLGDVSGTRNGEPWPRRGEVAELPDDEAQALCANRMAEPYEDSPDEPPAVETATAPTDGVEKR